MSDETTNVMLRLEPTGDGPEPTPEQYDQAAEQIAGAPAEIAGEPVTLTRVEPDPETAVAITAEPPLSDAEIEREAIRDLANEAAAAEADYEEKADIAKSAKKRWEGLLKRLQELARGKSRPMPLFDRPAPSAADEATPVVSDPAPEPEPWRAVPIADLGRFGLSPKLVETLCEAGITTIGKLADWSASEKKLVDIPGVGPGKATKIEEAMDGFWASQPRPAQEKSDDQAVIDTDLDAVLAAESDADAEAQAAGDDNAPAAEDLCRACGQVWTDCTCPGSVATVQAPDDQDDHDTSAAEAFFPGITAAIAENETTKERSEDMLIRMAVVDTVSPATRRLWDLEGASDTGIRTAIQGFWGCANDPGYPKPGNGYTTRGGARPAFWFGDTTPGPKAISGQFRKPDLQGQVLMDRIRKAVGIAQHGKTTEPPADLGWVHNANPLWRELAVTSLRVRGPLHGALLDAGVKTLAQLPELLASWTDEHLAGSWGMSADDAAAIRAAFHAIANPGYDPTATTTPDKPKPQRRRKGA